MITDTLVVFPSIPLDEYLGELLSFVLVTDYYVASH